MFHGSAASSDNSTFAMTFDPSFIMLCMVGAMASHGQSSTHIFEVSLAQTKNYSYTVLKIYTNTSNFSRQFMIRKRNFLMVLQLLVLPKCGFTLPFSVEFIGKNVFQYLELQIKSVPSADQLTPFLFLTIEMDKSQDSYIKLIVDVVVIILSLPCFIYHVRHNRVDSQKNILVTVSWFL